jgi:predicted Fe-S protein YdhL (DUF1289 family)
MNWDWGTVMNWDWGPVTDYETEVRWHYEAQVRWQIMRLRQGDGLWERGTMTNNGSEVPRRIMKVKYPDEWRPFDIASKITKRYRAESSNWSMLQDTTKRAVALRASLSQRQSRAVASTDIETPLRTLQQSHCAKYQQWSYMARWTCIVLRGYSNESRNSTKLQH